MLDRICLNFNSREKNKRNNGKKKKTTNEKKKKRLIKLLRTEKIGQSHVTFNTTKSETKVNEELNELLLI